MTPALTHEDASARLLDLVYGEAEGDARAAIEAHVAGCVQCKADLAALGDTHALLRGTFEDLPVPARAHARILEAANAAVAKPAVAAAARVPAATKPATPSFWERMRGRWTLPTLATVGAIAVVVVSSRMFLEPNRAFEQIEARRAPAEAESEPSAAAPPPPPVQAPIGAVPAAPPARGEQAPQASAEAIARRRAALEQLRLNPPGSRGALRSRSVDERLRAALGRLDGTAVGGGGVASGSGALGAAAPADKIAAKPTAAPERRPGAYASPPAGWAAEGEAKSDSSANSLKKGGGPASPQAAAPKAAKRSEALDDLARAPVAAAPSAPAKRKVALQKDLEERDEAPAAPAAEPMEEVSRAKSEAASPSADQKKEKAAVPTVDALARKAEQLYAAGRWNEAVAAYRELLRRFPDATPAPQWRTRLVQSQHQETAARAKAATKAAPAAQ